MRYTYTKIIKILELPNMKDKINVYVLTELEVTLVETLRNRLKILTRQIAAGVLGVRNPGVCDSL